MSHPFDDEGQYVVVANAEEQHSLWPAHLDVPAGWTVVHQTTDRDTALTYIEQAWQDMRPKSLR